MGGAENLVYHSHELSVRDCSGSDARMTGSGLARLDADGRLIWANPVFCDVLGGEPGAPVEELLAGKASGDAWRRLQDGHAVAVSHTDGRRFSLVPGEGE